MPLWLPYIISPLYDAYVKTLRVVFLGEDAFRDPVVYLFWHDSLFPLIYTHRKRKVVVLVSTHRDGELIARVLKLHGFLLARGSARRGRLRGAKEALVYARQGRSIAITPDGPIGPRRVMKPGALALARATGHRILYVGVGYSRNWTLNTWDRFRLPFPGARVVVYLEPYAGEDPKAAGERLNRVNRRAQELAVAMD